MKNVTSEVSIPSKYSALVMRFGLSLTLILSGCPARLSKSYQIRVTPSR